MTKTFKHRAGFTLMELLIVVAIIFALFAILLPVVNMQMQRWKLREVQMKLTTIEQALAEFHAEFGRYPTTEEGLRMLVFVPDNFGQVLLPGQGPGQIPGGQGQGGTVDPFTGMPTFNPMDGGGGGVSSEAFGNIDPITLQPIAGGMPGPMGTGPMGTGPMGTGAPSGTIDPNTGEFIPNPMDGGSGVIGGQATVWTITTGNDQLYIQRQKRPVPFIRESDLLDPWGQPYRYDNSLLYPLGIGGLNANGENRPAVWSAGPNRQDGDLDDIMNWKTEIANEAIAIYQRDAQNRQQWGAQPQTPYDPNNPMPFDPTNQMQFDPNNPMQFDPNNQGTGFPPQPQGTGGFPPQPQGTGGFPPQPQGTGGFPPQPQGTGGFPPQPSF